MLSPFKTMETIINQGILPCFSHDDPEISSSVMEALVGAGIKVIEYTSRNDAAIQHFKLLKARFGQDLLLGAGTIKHVDAPRRFIDAGADFIVSPVIDFDLCTFFRAAPVSWIPSSITRNELMTAQHCDCRLVKIFPAYLYGPPFIKEAVSNFPGKRYIPTGGIDISPPELKKWLEAGAAAVGVGSSLISQEIIEAGNYEALYKRTQQVLKTIADIKRMMIDQPK